MQIYIPSFVKSRESLFIGANEPQAALELQIPDPMD